MVSTARAIRSACASHKPTTFSSATHRTVIADYVSHSLTYIPLVTRLSSLDSMHSLIPTGEATAILPTGNKTPPVTVIGTDAIRQTFDEM